MLPKPGFISPTLYFPAKINKIAGGTFLTSKLGYGGSGLINWISSHTVQSLLSYIITYGISHKIPHQLFTTQKIRNPVISLWTPLLVQKSIDHGTTTFSMLANYVLIILTKWLIGYHPYTHNVFSSHVISAPRGELTHKQRDKKITLCATMNQGEDSTWIIDGYVVKRLNIRKNSLVTRTYAYIFCLLTTDKYSRHICILISANNNPPINTILTFLGNHGIYSGIWWICTYQGGQLAMSVELRACISEYGYTLECTGTGILFKT